jgi:hypothetical protein
MSTEPSSTPFRQNRTVPRRRRVCRRFIPFVEFECVVHSLVIDDSPASAREGQEEGADDMDSMGDSDETSGTTCLQLSLHVCCVDQG